MTRVVIVDYGLCNLDSISRAIEECGGRPRVSADPREVADADLIVLPGVGNFAKAMANLKDRRLDDAMGERVIENGVPFLGVCLGMQLMARHGSEGEGAGGLGWIDAEVRRLKPAAQDERVPHVGWNEVDAAEGAPLFEGIDPGRDFYFVHSFHLDTADPGLVQGRTPYCGGFVSAVAKDNLFGVQFHPEKSQKTGFRVLTNFLRM